jgi:tRNA A-37 threonylcarbamoyl transferase component Bud32
MTVKEFIIQMNNDFSHPAFEQLVSKLAHNLATMHINDNIHGDLTSSNMMIRPPEPLASLFSNDCPKLRAQDFVKDIG